MSSLTTSALGVSRDRLATADEIQPYPPSLSRQSASGKIALHQWPGKTEYPRTLFAPLIYLLVKKSSLVSSGAMSFSYQQGNCSSVFDQIRYFLLIAAIYFKDRNEARRFRSAPPLSSQTVTVRCILIRLTDHTVPHTHSRHASQAAANRLPALRPTGSQPRR